MVNLKAVVFLPLVAALPTARSGPAGDITCYYREDTMAKASDIRVCIDFLYDRGDQDCVAPKSSWDNKPSFCVYKTGGVWANNYEEEPVTKKCSFFANELDNILSKCERDGMVSGASMMGDPRNPDDENYFVSMYNRNVLGH